MTILKTKHGLFTTKMENDFNSLKGEYNELRNELTIVDGMIRHTIKVRDEDIATRFYKEYVLGGCRVVTRDRRPEVRTTTTDAADVAVGALIVGGILGILAGCCGGKK